MRPSIFHRVSCALLLIAPGALSLSPGAWAADAKALPSDLALVPTECPGFVSIAPGALLTSDLGKQLVRHLDKEDIGLLVQQCLHTAVAGENLERVVVFPGSSTFLVRTKREYERAHVIAHYALNNPGTPYKGWNIYPGLGWSGVALVDQNDFVCGREEELQRLFDWQDLAKNSGALKDLLPLAAEKHFLVMGLNPRTILKADGIWHQPVAPGQVPPTDLAGAVTLPAELKPFESLLQANALVLVVDVTDAVRLEARLTFPTNELANAGEEGAKAVMDLAGDSLERLARHLAVTPEVAEQLSPLFKQFRAAAKEATVRKAGRTVTVTARLKLEDAVHAAAAAYVADRAQQMATAANLRRLALEMMEFSDTYDGYLPPPAILSKDGKPLLSWRVALLPFLGEEALYKEFHLNEPWDSEHNKKLLAKMPKVYASGRKRSKDPYATHFQVFIGDAAPFKIKPGPGPLGARGPRFPLDFPDGTSNTMLIVEAADAVPWTKPVDLAFDEKKPVPKLGRHSPLGFHAAFADGSDHFLRSNVPESTLKLLINPADGMVIPGYGEIVGGLFPVFAD